MGLADFGGGVDYAGLFASLARQSEQDAERALRESIADSEEEQAAADAEKYDQWKNGLISNDDWLAYLRQRVAATKTDPEEHQRWVETLREHESAIRDAQMEAAFQTGDVSIHRLIAHYQSRMKGVEKNSPAYREWAARYASLVDQRDAAARQGSRSGTPYWPKGFKPAQGAGPSGSDEDEPIDPVNELRPYEDFEDYVEGLFGDLKRIDEINRQIEANPGIKMVTDPLTGETFEVGDDFFNAMDEQYLRTEDFIAAAKWANNDADGAIDALAGKGEYVGQVVQVRNSQRATPYWNAARDTFLSTIVAASQIADPEQRARVYQQAYASMQKTSDGILYAGVREERLGFGERVESERSERKQRIKTELPELGRVDERMVGEMTYMLRLGQAFSDPALSLDQRAQLMSEVLDSRPEGFFLTAEQIQEYADGNAEIGLVGGMETHVAREGLAAGTHAFYFDGQTTRVLTPGEIQEASPPDPSTGAPSVVPTYQRVDGRTQRVFAAVRPVESDFFAYQYTRAAGEELVGTFVPSSEINSMAKGAFERGLQSGLYERVPVQPGWRSTIMNDGSTWYEDPSTGLWYKNRLPVTTSKDVTGGILVDESGKVQYNFSRFASAGGVMVPFSGISSKDMQRQVELDVAAGVLNPGDYASRDETGEAQYAPPDIEGMYWDPAAARERGEFDRRTEFNRLRAEGLRDNFVERQESRIEAKANDWARTMLDPLERRDWRNHGVDPVQFATDRMNEFGKSVGIVIPTPKRPDRSVPDPRDPRAEAMEGIERRSRVERPPSLPPIRTKLPERLPQFASGNIVAPRLSLPPIRPVTPVSINIRRPQIDRDLADRVSASRRRAGRGESRY